MPEENGIASNGQRIGLKVQRILVVILVSLLMDQQRTAPLLLFVHKNGHSPLIVKSDKLGNAIKAVMKQGPMTFN